ncbi:hypothetical protein FRC05_004300 [Tulasnella sp. 425]|nr:hypothetical protein FRC05_004300 [Tulasnella sp. 425]
MSSEPRAAVTAVLAGTLIPLEAHLATSARVPGSIPPFVPITTMIARQPGPRPQLPDYTTSCGMVADNVCPNTTGSGPQGTAISRKRRDVQCTKGFEACPRFSGRGGFDCVDTENDPEACGGCPSDDGQGSGTDCTAIKGVSVTRCVKRSCVIDSCRKGWVKSLDGTSCVSASHPTGSSDGIHVQDTDAKKKRSSAKRAIRANIY